MQWPDEGIAQTPYHVWFKWDVWFIAPKRWPHSSRNESQNILRTLNTDDDHLSSIYESANHIRTRKFLESCLIRNLLKLIFLLRRKTNESQTLKINCRIFISQQSKISQAKNLPDPLLIAPLRNESQGIFSWIKTWIKLTKKLHEAMAMKKLFWSQS